MDERTMDSLQRTTFLDAVRANAVDHVQVLLRDTPSLGTNALDDDGGSALIVAARQGHRTMVEVLLPYSDPHAIDDVDANALMIAAQAGHLDVVRALIPVSDLAYRPMSDTGDEQRFGLSAIERATQAGHDHIVDVLWQPMKAVMPPDDYGWEVLAQLAAQRGSQPLLERVVQDPDLSVSVGDPDVGPRLLHKAIAGGTMSIARWAMIGTLIAQGVSPTVRVDGQTALVLAIDHDHDSSHGLLDLLCQHAPTSSDGMGDAIAHAVEQENTAALRTLIGWADLDTVRSFLDTVAHDGRSNVWVKQYQASWATLLAEREANVLHAVAAKPDQGMEPHRARL